MQPKEEARPVLSLSKTQALVGSNMLGILDEMRREGMITQAQFSKIRDKNTEIIYSEIDDPYKIIGWFNDTFLPDVRKDYVQAKKRWDY